MYNKYKIFNERDCKLTANVCKPFGSSSSFSNPFAHVCTPLQSLFLSQDSVLPYCNKLIHSIKETKLRSKFNHHIKTLFP